ncbi:MAG: hypothetical protein WCQ64_07740 [Acidobacteriota bacterium]
MSRVHSPRSAKKFVPFLLLNVAMWFVMTAILLVLPDQLDRWMDLSVGRAIAWAVAGAVWVVAVERQWQARMGALARFPLQVVLWVSSALVAMWLSDQFRL